MANYVQFSYPIYSLGYVLRVLKCENKLVTRDVGTVYLTQLIYLRLKLRCVCVGGLRDSWVDSVNVEMLFQGQFVLSPFDR